MDTPHPTPDPDAPTDARMPAWMEELHRSIRRGAQFLDTAVPDWFHPNCATPVNLNNLHLGHFAHCVLGQLTAIPAAPTFGAGFRTWTQAVIRHPQIGPQLMAYWAAQAAAAPTVTYPLSQFHGWAIDHGFYPPPLWPVHVDWAAMATTAWRDLIATRRYTFGMTLDM